jgi:hypothetical protein
LEEYPLHGYCAELEHLILNAGREQEKGGEGLAVHYDEYLYLPFSLEDYKGRYLYSPGREGLPLHLESLSPEIEYENMVSNLDANPNFSRSAKRPEMHCALREGRVDKALFIGGSNASKLATATAMLGVDTAKIAKGGWKVTSDSVDLILNDIEEQLSGMPPDTPIVLYCMDNSAFMSVSSDGSMAPLAKGTGGESGYHAAGELIVAPDRALVSPINNLRRLVDACGEHPVFVISPHFRFVRGPCCYAAGHMTNFGDPDFIKEMVKDLSRVFQLLKRSLPNVKVVEGMELICGKKYNLERATAAATTCWAGDVIHPTSHTNAKMALHLLEAIAPQEAPRPGGSAQAGSGRGGGGSGGGGGGASNRKRTHSECESVPRNTSRHTERSRNWAEQRRDQPRMVLDSISTVDPVTPSWASGVTAASSASSEGEAVAVTTASSIAAAEGPTTGAGCPAANAATKFAVRRSGSVGSELRIK